MNPLHSEPSHGGHPAVPDFFALLGVPRRWSIDRDALERSYLELAARVHPDRFSGAPPRERRQAMEQSAALNEAYRTLRDPVARAEYLVKLGGIDLDSSDPVHGAPQMDQAFLVDMIERREALAQARVDGSAAVDELRDQLEQEMADVFGHAIEAIESGETRGAARALVVHRYLQRLLDEIDRVT